MADVILYIAVSVDGYIADEQGGVSWLDRYNQDGIDYGYDAFFRRLGAVVMGGNTYRQVLGFGDWPYSEVETCILTRQGIGDPPAPNVRAYAGKMDVLVSELKSRLEQDIWLVGGTQVIKAFLDLDLVDEFIITVIPTLLGKGLPLFSGSERGNDLQLVESRPFPNGVVQLTYRR